MADIIQLRDVTDAPNLMVAEPKLKVDMTAYIEHHHFRFDAVFDEFSSNSSVYDGSAASLIGRLFNGQSSTCFAYGATGAGKTHTMMGTEAEPGLYLLAARSIFIQLSNPKHAGLELRVSCYEIYGGKVFDLLNGRRCLVVREDARKRVNVVGLKERHVAGLDAFRSLLLEAADARRTAATCAHADSSRSHAVLQLSLRRAAATPPPGPTGRGATAAATEEEEVGRFCFVDLAGTERGADTLNSDDRERRLEGAEINKSLLALKECIRGLDLGKAHVPFRGSKLTEVLRDSFVGDCHTVMIGAISPGKDAVEQTLNTLRYAERVRAFSSTEKGTYTSERSSGGTAPLLLASPRAQRPPSSSRRPATTLGSGDASRSPGTRRGGVADLNRSPSTRRGGAALAAREASRSPATRRAGSILKPEFSSKRFGAEGSRSSVGSVKFTSRDAPAAVTLRRGAPTVAVDLAVMDAEEQPPESALPDARRLLAEEGGEEAKVAWQEPLPPQEPAVAVNDDKENHQAKPRGSESEVSTELRAVLDAHQEFINDAMSRLELHKYMLQHIDAGHDPTTSPAEYVGSLEALLKERAKPLNDLLAAISAFNGESTA